MNILYIGNYGAGKTTRARGEAIKKLLGEDKVDVIDTEVPLKRAWRPVRSFGFRYKKGPLLDNINRYILENISGDYDVIWVDKGVFIFRETVKKLKERTKILLHYTPDAAFYENRSRHFKEGIELYDFLVSTKNFEKDKYLEFVPEEKLILTTQGYDASVHYPRNEFKEKEECCAFVGLYESSRGKAVSGLLRAGVCVKIAGKGWNRFVRRHKGSKLTCLGEALWLDKYAALISRAKFGLGFLNKSFPEKHTTRTFEIPACGTALVTERNEETSSFFNEDEAIFYDTPGEMVEKIRYYMVHSDELEELTCKGRERVVGGGFDYESQIRDIFKRIGALA
ncbi:MAG: glycosyltransferase [Candidatus Omnitrophica bacterium]|nr:glycosyltransferase [Candidatus Omnitrophota bacterium]